MKRALLAFLFLASTALAAAPELVGRAPKQGRVGRLVTVDARASKGYTTLAWAVFPKQIEEAVLPSLDRAGNPTQLGFAWDEPITVTFVLAGANADGEVSILATEVALAGPGPAPGPQPGPGPGPEPGPTPPPDPPPAPAPTSWAGLALAWAVAVTDPDKAATAGKIADGFEEVSAGIAAGIGQSLIVAPADLTAQYVRLDVNDSTNPDGFINIPLAFVGPVWAPIASADPSSSFGRDDRIDDVQTLGGQEWPVLRWHRRHWQIVLQAVAQAEVWASLMPLDLVARTGANILYVPDSASTDAAKEAVFGRLRTTGDLTYPSQSASLRTWRATIEERL